MSNYVKPNRLIKYGVGKKIVVFLLFLIENERRLHISNLRQCNTPFDFVLFSSKNKKYIIKGQRGRHKKRLNLLYKKR
jgi:hypothetical protein